MYHNLFKNPPVGHLFDTTGSGETSIFIHKALSLFTLNMFMRTSLQLNIFNCNIWKVPLKFFFLTFTLWPCHSACCTLVPQPGIEPLSPALEVQSLNHWTSREVPLFLFYFALMVLIFLFCVSWTLSQISFGETECLFRDILVKLRYRYAWSGWAKVWSILD